MVRTPQDLANEMLADWQRQRLAGIPARDRRLNEDFERDIEIIRQVMERRS